MATEEALITHYQKKYKKIMANNNLKKVSKSIIAGIISQIPVVSGISAAVAEYANLSWKERTETTQKILFDKIAQQDKKFEQRAQVAKNLASILRTTYQSALNDIEENKISLYANAFINAINQESIEDTKIHMFLNLLRDFTILHIEVLKYFSKSHTGQYNIQKHMNSFTMRSPKDVLVEIISSSDDKIISDVYLFGTIMNDLYNKRLLKIPSLDELYKVGFMDSMINKVTTQLGDEFLKFIEDNSNTKL